MRIIAAHAYHRIDYETVWVTLRDGRAGGLRHAAGRHRALSSQLPGFRLAATLVRKLTRKVYNSDHDYCRNACAVVRSQGSPL
jgi:hypothetical protein